MVGPARLGLYSALAYVSLDTVLSYIYPKDKGRQAASDWNLLLPLYDFCLHSDRISTPNQFSLVAGVLRAHLIPF